MNTTKKWAESLGVATDSGLPPVANYSKAYARDSNEVAVRAIILQGVIAVACDVDARPITDWFKAQGIWDRVTPKERKFLANRKKTDAEKISFRWKQEAQWTLLWMVQHVETLGLPTHYCDTRRIADEIMPGLGDDIHPFLDKSQLRSGGAFLAEDDRTYNLWCYALADQKQGKDLPGDLNLGVLRERRYAFEWMDGFQDWDDVTCDA